MFKKLISTIITFGALVGVCCPAAGYYIRPVVVVTRLSESEVSGKSVQQAVWKRPASIAQFTNLYGNGIPTQKTEIRFAYDNKNLYVAFLCKESQMAKIKTEYKEPDSFIWRDDSISITLSPHNKADKLFFMTANTIPAKYDDRDTSKSDSWNGKWTVDVKKDKDNWTSFITIPFAELEVSTPRPGDKWGGNFNRKATPADESSVWSPILSDLRDMKRWGDIIFADSITPVVSISVPEIPTPGQYQYQAVIANPSKKPLQMKIETLVDGKLIQKQMLKVKPGNNTSSVKLNYPYDGKHELIANVWDINKHKLLARTTHVLINIPNNSAQVQKFTTIVKALKPTNAEAIQEKAEIMELLSGLSKRVKSAQGDKVKWDQLGSGVDIAEKAVSHFRNLCADKEGKGYAIGTETPIRKIMRDTLFEGKLGEPARISIAKNEYESTQVVVFAYKSKLDQVQITPSDLKGPNGSVIPANNVALNLVEYVKTRKPKYDVDYVGWWPDPLMDMKPFDVESGGMQPVWVTVNTPENIASGTYSGTLTIKPANALETAFPIEVKVWNFTLPTQPHMKTAFAFFEDEAGAWYHSIPQDMHRGFYDFLLKHHLNPTNIYSSKPVPEKFDIPFSVERGLNEMCLACTYNKDNKGREELANMLRDYESYLKEKGWWDKAYIYGFDEIPPQKYNELRDMYGWVKKEFPDLPRMCTTAPNKDLKGYIDIWVPLTANWKQKDAEEYTKNGDQVWWYTCCNPVHPYANFFIDYPAIDPRILFWQSWKYKVPGFLYYSTNLWESNRSTVSRPGEMQPIEDPAVIDAINHGKRWPEVPWNTFSFDNFNGDGMLIYPGPNGHLLSSIRLEAIRDGIDDYEYFYQLNELVKSVENSNKVNKATLDKAKKILKVRNDVVESVTEYTKDPKLLGKAREEVAEMIEKLTAISSQASIQKTKMNDKKQSTERTTMKPTSANEKTTNILFIGNSYTYFNNLPGILEQFSADAKLDHPIHCTMATVGGATLQMHWDNPKFRELLNSKKWDFVTLQEQSLRPIEKPDLFQQYTKLWIDEIKHDGGKPILYMTWARKATPEKQPILTENYRSAGKEYGALVVPVGEAWRMVREQKPDIELFISDGSHPNPTGSYLAACTFYAAITGKSPIGLPGKFDIIDNDGKVKSNVELKPDDALFLQQSAWSAVEKEKGL